MDEKKYSVVFSGKIKEGEDIEKVKQSLTSALKVDPSNLDMLFSGKRIIIKKNSDLPTCENLKRAMERAGALCAIEESGGPPAGKSNPPPKEDQGPKTPPPLPPRRGPEPSGQEAGPPQRGPDEKFCDSCGSIIKMNALSCPYCGKAVEKKKMGCLPKAAIALGIGFFVIIPIIGILAAIAIPQFMAYRNRAYEASVKAELMMLVEAERVYQSRHGTYAPSLEDLGYELSSPQVFLEITSADQDCFEAVGTHEKLYDREIRADCNGLEETDTMGGPVSESR
jgi:Tfp pilus assembly protein PilE